MKTINLTQIHMINYPFRSTREPHCRLFLYTGAGTAGDVSFHRGLAVLLAPDQLLEIIPSDAPGSLSVLSFPAELLTGSLAFLRAAPRTLVPDPPGVYLDYVSAARSLLSEYQDDTAAHQTLTSLLGWLSLLVPKPAPVEQAGTHPRQLVEQAKDIIHREYATDLTLQAVAAALFVNPCYLSTVFHQVTGTTFRSYLKDVRLQHTCKLLTQTNHLITDIAMQTGFNSTAYLISTFRKVYGITPSAYRALHGEH